MRFNAKQMRAMKDKARAAGQASGRRLGRVKLVLCLIVGIAIGEGYQYLRPNDVPRLAEWLHATCVGEAQQ
jgi:hypothetical protein